MERVEIEPTMCFEDAVKEVLERSKLINQPVVAIFDEFIIDSENGYYKNVDLYYVYKARQKKYNNIDWEQRRYEIAKEMLPFFVREHSTKLTNINVDIFANSSAYNAVYFANALINELKKETRQ